VTFILFNAGGAFALLVAGAYVVRASLFPETEPPCSTAYASVIELPYERSGGALMTPVELQGRLAGRDFGVLENARIVRVKESASPVLEVSLPKGSLGPRATTGTPGGVGFQWRPAGLTTAKAACLSYSVWLPDDFDFKRGGTLPGLFGVAEDRRGAERSAFAVRFMWRDAGAGELLTTLPVAGMTGYDQRTSTSDSDAFRLQTGRWRRLEQEVVLNTPEKKDGAIKVWADGRLVVDRKNVMLRETASGAFAGVQADAHYGGGDSSFIAPKDTMLRLTPFQLRVK
jgi:hypothetical protein